MARETVYGCRVSELTRWDVARGHAQRYIERFRRMAANAVMMTGMACSRHATVVPAESDGGHQ